MKNLRQMFRALQCLPHLLQLWLQLLLLVVTLMRAMRMEARMGTRTGWMPVSTTIQGWKTLGSKSTLSTHSAIHGDFFLFSHLHFIELRSHASWFCQAILD